MWYGNKEKEVDTEGIGDPWAEDLWSGDPEAKRRREILALSKQVKPETDPGNDPTNIDRMVRSGVPGVQKIQEDGINQLEKIGRRKKLE